MEISLEHVQCDCGVQASVWWKAAAWGVWTEGYFWLFDVCTAKFAPAELLLSSYSLRIFEMTSGFGQNSNRNFFDHLTSCRIGLTECPFTLSCELSITLASPVTSTCDTEILCKTGGGPLLWQTAIHWNLESVTRVSVKCINVSRTISCCSGDKEGGKNFDSHTQSRNGSRISLWVAGRPYDPWGTTGCQSLMVMVLKEEAATPRDSWLCLTAKFSNTRL